MTDDHKAPDIKVTDRRHFDRTGEKRPPEEVSAEAETTRAEGKPAPASGSEASSSAPKRGPERPAEAPRKEPVATAEPRGARAADPDPSEGLSEAAASLSSSFSLLVARLAQETEIYLGLVPYPGKETSEPDLEAARAMIDLLSMLQEKTRGNLTSEEAGLLQNLLYTYRLEYVRVRPDAGVR